MMVFKYKFNFTQDLGRLIKIIFLLWNESLMFISGGSHFLWHWSKTVLQDFHACVYFRIVRHSTGWNKIECRVQYYILKIRASQWGSCSPCLHACRPYNFKCWTWKKFPLKSICLNDVFSNREIPKKYHLTQNIFDLKLLLTKQNRKKKKKNDT